MHKIRNILIALWMLALSATTATAGVSIGIGIGLPNLSIGINLPVYPDLVPVPGYPVYYAPGVAGNYFFYDGMYWVYQNDNWYASSWYNGPWGIVDPQVVPLFILRIPVRYYREPPMYFRGWRSDASPRWGEHWGREWQERRSGWDRWNHSSAPVRAPLPLYQRQYAKDRYPRVEQQKTLRNQNYRYQPRDTVVRQHFREQGAPRAQQPARGGGPREEAQRPTPQHQRGENARPASQTPQQRAPSQAPQQRAPSSREQRQQAPAAQSPQQRAPAQAPQQRAPSSREQRQQAPAAQSPQQRAPAQAPQQRAPAPREQRQQPTAAPEQHQQRPQGQEPGARQQGEPREPGRGHEQGQKDEERGRGQR